MLPCGPAHVDELARNTQARVYEVRGDAFACHRGRAPITLGSADRIVRVYLRGRYAGVQRRELYGESLRVYDLRARTARRYKARVRKVVAVQLSDRGFGFYIADTLRSGRQIRDTSGGDHGGTSGDHLLYKGALLAFPGPDGVGISGIDEDSPAARSGRLITWGRVHVDVRGRGLSASRDGEAPLPLGAGLSGCLSPSSCAGIVGLTFRADRFVATRSIDTSLGGQPDDYVIHDLDTRTRRRPCENPAVVILTDSGRAACSQYGPEPRILSEGTVLDAGPRVDVTSLQRRGDRLVWLRDGVEHTAPLP